MIDFGGGGRGMGRRAALSGSTFGEQSGTKRNAALMAALAAASMLAAPVAAQTQVIRGAEIGATGPISIQLDGIPTSALVVMLMRDVMRVPYVIAPDVLQDRRPTSVRLVIPRDKVPQRVVGYLRQSGFNVQLQAGTVYVSRNGASPSSSAGPSFGPDTPSGSPLAPYAGPPQEVVGGPAAGAATSGVEAEPEVADGLLAYVPAHRDPSYLATVLGPLFTSVTFGARDQASAEPDQQRILSTNGPDVLLMAGPPDDLERVRQALGVLDRPRALVAVKAVVMQVSDTVTRGSALSLLASIAGGRVSAGSFAEAAPGAQFLRLATGSLSAVLSVVNEDSRFKVVASPNLSALSGSVATINAGSQVPTLGAVAVSEGTATQSVVYRDSGITLEVRPVVRGGLIQLDVRQERSNFVPTTTGVDDSPTLQTASVTAQALLRPGESMVLAGLTEESTGNRKEGLFGGLLGVRSRDKAESELLVMLQADLVPAGDVIAGQFIDLGGPGDAEAGVDEG